MLCNLDTSDWIGSEMGNPSCSYKQQIERIGAATCLEPTLGKEIFPVSVFMKQCIYPWIIVYFDQQDWLMLRQSLLRTD